MNVTEISKKAADRLMKQASSDAEGYKLNPTLLQATVGGGALGTLLGAGGGLLSAAISDDKDKSYWRRAALGALIGGGVGAGGGALAQHTGALRGTRVSSAVGDAINGLFGDAAVAAPTDDAVVKAREKVLELVPKGLSPAARLAYAEKLLKTLQEEAAAPGRLNDPNYEAWRWHADHEAGLLYDALQQWQREKEIYNRKLQEWDDLK